MTMQLEVISFLDFKLYQGICVKTNFSIFRKFHKEKIHCNGFSISADDNVATFWLQNLGDYIVVVIQGSEPTKLVTKVNELIANTCYVYPAMKLNPFFICPKCLTDMISTSKENKYMELPEDVIKSKFTEQELHDTKREILCCSQNRHRIQRHVILNGYNPFDKSVNVLTTDVKEEARLIQGTRHIYSN